MSTRLLIVEDEEHLAAGLKLNLELDAYTVDVARSGREAAQHLLTKKYDAIILDVMLPDVDGFTICRGLRDAGNFTPVIMLTARGSAEDRVKGLEAGADDYLPKPFALAELLARVRSMLRRRGWEQERSPSHHEQVYRFGQAEVDFSTQFVSVAGVQRKLTKLEFDLLRYFIDHPGRVLSRDELLEQVWKLRTTSPLRTIDNFVARLRKHFEPDVANPRHFESVRGTGYRFVP